MTVVKEETKQEEGTKVEEYEAGTIVKVAELDVDVADPNEDDGEKKPDGDENSAVSLEAPWIERYIEVLKAYWPLGLIAFGGPPAHFAILKDHLVSDNVKRLTPC